MRFLHHLLSFGLGFGCGVLISYWPPWARIPARVLLVLAGAMMGLALHGVYGVVSQVHGNFLAIAFIAGIFVGSKPAARLREVQPQDHSE